MQSQDGNSTFFRNLLRSMRYPNLESSHQALLAAALTTRPELVTALVSPRNDTGAFGDWTAPDPLAPLSDKGVKVEHSPDNQNAGRRKSRFDILMAFRGATVVVECKWSAQTDLGQLVRYARLLTERPDSYPNPVLVLVSVDGTAPANAASLHDALKVPLRFVSWNDVAGIIKPVVDGADPQFVATIDRTTTSLANFARTVCGGDAIPVRNDVGTGLPNDDLEADDDDDGVSETEGTRGDFIDPAIPERFALGCLASDVIQALEKRGLGLWHVSMPPTKGTRGDVQCDLAPNSLLAPSAVEAGLRELGRSEGWNFELGHLTRPADAGPALDAFKRLATASHREPDDVRGLTLHQRLAVRLYFSQKGDFRVVFGANLRPYLNDLLSGRRQRNAFNTLSRLTNEEVGVYGPSGFEPGETAQRLHEVLVSWTSGLAKQGGWKKLGKTAPSMWTAYASNLQLASAGSESRANRIAAAVEALVRGNTAASAAPEGPQALPNERNRIGVGPIRQAVTAFVSAANVGGADLVQVGGQADPARTGRVFESTGVVPRRWLSLPRRQSQTGTDHFWTGLPLAFWFQADDYLLRLTFEVGPCDDPDFRERLKTALVAHKFKLGDSQTYTRFDKWTRAHHGDLPGTMLALWRDAELSLSRVDEALADLGLCQR